MKNIKIFSAALLIVAMAFSVSSCKRGKEDPFLSFRSRDGRLAGTWKLTGVEGKTVSTTVNGSTTTVSTTTRSYSGGTMTTTTTNSSGSSSSVNKFNYQMTLEKDGSLSSKTDYYNTSGTLTSAYEAERTWNWINDGKNKSSVNIADPSGPIVYGVTEVLMLKNKKLQLTKHQRSRSASGSFSSESDATDTYTFEAD